MQMLPLSFLFLSYLFLKIFFLSTPKVIHGAFFTYLILCYSAIYQNAGGPTRKRL